jgi:hypothetical protein
LTASYNISLSTATETVKAFLILLIINSKLPIIQHVWGMESASGMRETDVKPQYKVKTTHFHFSSCKGVFVGYIAD